MIYMTAALVFGGLTTVLALGLIVAERFLVNYGICKLDINVGEKPLEVEGGQTLLSALYANEIFIPSACGGKGTCAYCKVKVHEGGGPLLPTETPYLTPEESEAHVRLSISTVDEGEIAEGVRRLAGALRAAHAGRTP